MVGLLIAGTTVYGMGTGSRKASCHMSDPSSDSYGGLQNFLRLGVFQAGDIEKGCTPAVHHSLVRDPRNSSGL